MSNKYHAGTEFTDEQRDALDTAFQVWLDAESVNEYHAWDYEPARNDADTAYDVYHSLCAKFTAANATKHGVATGNQNGFTSVATEQMLEAAASDDAEMVAEMSKVQGIILRGQQVTRRFYYPYAETMVENFQRQLREGVDYGDDFNGRKLVDQEPTHEGWD